MLRKAKQELKRPFPCPFSQDYTGVRCSMNSLIGEQDWQFNMCPYNLCNVVWFLNGFDLQLMILYVQTANARCGPYHSIAWELRHRHSDYDNVGVLYVLYFWILGADICTVLCALFQFCQINTILIRNYFVLGGLY